MMSRPANKMKVFAFLIVVIFTTSVLFTNCSKGGFNVLERAGEIGLGSSSSEPLGIQVRFSSAPQAMVTSDSATFAFELSGQNTSAVKLQCYLNTVLQPTCQSPVVLSGLSDNDYSFEVTASNQNGLVLAQDKRAFRIDKTAPILTINQAPGAQIGTASTSISFSMSDNFADVTAYCALDAAAYAVCASPMALSNLAVGAHSFKLFTQDKAGNKSALQTISFSVVLGIPTVTLSQTPGAFSKTNSVSFSFSGMSSNSTISSYECSIDNGAYAACTSPKSYTGLTEAVHTFAARAKDALGQTSSPASYSFFVDLTKPSTPVVSSNLMNPSKTTSLNLMFSSSDSSGIASYECKVDAGAFAACTSPQAYSALSSASHTFAVRSTDKAGNVSSEGSYTIVIDTVAPIASITGKPDASTSSTSASFVFSASDALSGLNLVECQLDAQAYASCTSPQAYNGLAQGMHTFNLRVSDKAGNLLVQSASWTVVMATPSPTPVSTPDPCAAPSQPGRVGLARLTTRQLENTLKDLTTFTSTAPQGFPRDDMTGGYVSMPETQLMSSLFVEMYMDWVFALAQQVVAQPPAAVISCDYTVSNAATCVDKIISDFLYRAFRKPVVAADKTLFLNQYNAFSGTPQEKMTTVLASIMFSPNFLYREITNPPAGSTNSLALNPYELASRLSYFAWETMPDATLLAKAQSGELSKPDVLATELKRLIQSPRIEGMARSITDQWFGYGSIWQHSLNTTTFPNFNNSMKQSMYNETLQFIKYLIQQNRPVAELVNAQYSFVDSNLASLYGISVPANTPLTMTNLANTTHQGILGHPGVLALTSSGEKTSIVRRGLWVNDKLFCTTFGAPPAGVDTTLPTNLPADATPRELMEAHRTNPSCAACHSLIDPPGLVLETFDPLGRSRSLYSTGRTIDTSTTLTNGTLILDTKALNAYLAADKSFVSCVTKRIVPLAAGRVTKFNDQCSIYNVTQGKVPGDITFGQLLENMVKGMMFTMQAGE